MTDAETAAKPIKRLGGLAVYGERRVGAMLLLGFAAGLPNLLIFDTLSAWLRDAGVTLEVIAFFGLATLTYLFSGAIMHRDSLGTVQEITPGAVNLMAAGKGITHSERMPAHVRQDDAAVEGIQMWLALPKPLEEMEPEFLHYSSTAMPEFNGDGIHLHLVMGSALGLTSPVKTYAPTLFAALTMKAGSQFQLPADYSELAFYVVKGEVYTDQDEKVEAFNLGIAADHDGLCLIAEQDSTLIVLGGEPLDGRRFLNWNFVSSRKERIEQAREDWIHRRFPTIPGDDQEYIPLPR